MNKFGAYKIGAVKIGVILALVLLIFLVLPSILSTPILKSQYNLGDRIKINLPGDNIKVQIVTPASSYIREYSNSFLFEPNQTGNYKIIFGGNIYLFSVVGNSSNGSIESTVPQVSKTVSVSEIFSNPYSNLIPSGQSQRSFSLSENVRLNMQRNSSSGLFSSFARFIEPNPKVSIYNSLGEEVHLNTTLNDSGNNISLNIQKSRAIKPGEYTAIVDGWFGSYSQSFIWGLISLNTLKSTYRTGDNATFEIVVLNKQGEGVCGAPISLTVTDPSNLTSEIGNISGDSFDCGLYYAVYPVSEEGNYKVNVKTLVDGEVLGFETGFLADNNPPYEIIRHTESKIDPTKENNFSVSIEVKSYVGSGMNITESVPSSFKVFNTHAKISTHGDVKFLTWEVGGSDTNLSYNYSVPYVWPYLYELGPLEVNNYSEPRPWYVAVDPSKTVGGFCTGIIQCLSYGSSVTCTCSQISAIDSTYLGTVLRARTNSGGGALAVVNLSNSSLVPSGAVINSAILNLNYYIGGTAPSRCTISYSDDGMSSWNTVNSNCVGHTTKSTESHNLSSLTPSQLDKIIFNVTMAPPASRFSTANLYIDYANLTVTYTTGGPLSVNLTSPKDSYVSRKNNVTFHYVPNSDGILQNCTLWDNSSGTFSSVASDLSPVNGTQNSFSKNYSSGVYKWNVQCWDFPNGPAFALQNYTFVVDTTPPNVTLISPANNSNSNSPFGTTFYYNVSDRFDNIANCSLVLDGNIYETDSSIAYANNQSFITYIPNGAHTWSVQCTDGAGYTSAPAARKLNVAISSNYIASPLYETGTSNYFSPANILLNKTRDVTENNAAISISGNRLSNIVNATSAFAGGGGLIIGAGTISFSAVAQANVSSFRAEAYLTWKLYVTNSTGDYLICQSGNDNTGGTAVSSTTKSTWTGSCTTSSSVYIGATSKIKLVLDAYNYGRFGGGQAMLLTHYWDSSDNSYVNFGGGIYSVGSILTNLTYPRSDKTFNSGTNFNMTCSVNCTIGVCPGTTVYAQYSTGTNSSWYSSGWGRRKLITIPSGKVTQNLVNFPVLINMTDSDLHNYALSNGNDILFTDSQAHLLPYEMEYFNKSYTSSKAYLVAWVKMNLSASSNNYIWMYYNNSGSSSHANPSSVWSNGYKTVYHMNQINALDSLGSHNATSVGSISGASGKIDGADNFNGASYLNTTYLQSSVTQYTISAWVKTTSASGVVVQDRGSGAGLSITLAIDPSCGSSGCTGAISGVPAVGVDSNAVWRGVGGNSSMTVNNGVWHYITGVFNSTSGQTLTASNFAIYIDGKNSSKVYSNQAGTPTSPLTGLSGTQIGHHAAWNQFYTGQIDELTISNVARSSAWINATYRNELNSSTFYSVGSVQTLQAYGLLWSNVSHSGNIILASGETNGHSLGTTTTSGSSTNFSLTAASSSSNVRCYATSYGSSSISPIMRKISTLVDTTPPNVTLISPANNSNVSSDYGVKFIFKATDNNYVKNCTLTLDSSKIYTNTSIVQGANTSFQTYVSPGSHTWSVKCYDLSGNFNQTGTRKVNVINSGLSFSSLWYETGTSNYVVPANIYLNTTRDGTENNAAISINGNSLSNIVNATSPYMGNNGAVIPAGTISFSAVAQANVSSFRAEAYLTWKLYVSNTTGNYLVCQSGNDNTGGTAVSSTTKSTWTGSCTTSSQIHLKPSDQLKLVLDAYNYGRFGGGQTMRLTHYWDSSDNSYVNIAGFSSLGNLNVDLTQPVVNQDISSGQEFNATCSLNCSIGICTNAHAYIQYNTSVLSWTNIGSAGNIVLSSGETNGHSLGNVGTIGNSTIFRLIGASSVSNIRCIASSDYSNATGTTTKKITIAADTIPPHVNLISPANNSHITSNYGVNFVFNATDNNRLANCSLFIDGANSYTNYSMIQGVPTKVNRYLSPGVHNWSVNCYDFAGNLNQTQTRTVNVSVPNLTFLPIFYETSGSNYASTANINLSNSRDATENNVAVSVPSGSLYKLVSAVSPYMGNNGALLGSGTISFSAVARASAINSIYLTWKAYISNSTGDYLICQSGNDGTGGTRITSTTKTTWTGSCNNPSSVYLIPGDQIKLVIDAYNAGGSSIAVTHYWDNLDLSDLQFTSFNTIGNITTDLIYPKSDLYNVNVGTTFNVTCQVNCSIGTCYNTRAYVQYNLSSVDWISVGSSGNIILNSGQTNPHNLGNLGAGATSTNFTLKGNIASINNLRCMVIADHSSDIGTTTRKVGIVQGAEAPTASLVTPDNIWFNTTSPTLYYVPSDANNNLANSTLVLNGLVDLTNQTPLRNAVTNNFTLSGLSQGYYNWSVNVTDTTNLKGSSSQRTFIVDTQKPLISLSSPSNNSNIYSSDVNFNFVSTDNLAPTMTCSLYLNGVKKGSSFNVDNGTLGSPGIGTWWNGSWKYREQFNLSVPSGSTPAGYQTKIILNSSNVGSDFSWSSECVNSNSSRIRFVNSYQNSTLPYWVQSCSVSGHNMTVWVKLDKILNPTGYSIYLYYGNPSASIYSNGTATFDYFDSGSSVSSWTVAGSAGQTSIQGDPAPSYYAVSQSGDYMYKNVNLKPNETIMFDSMSNYLGNFFFLTNSAGAGQMFRTETRTGQSAGIASATSWTSWSAPSSCAHLTASTWYNIQINLGSTTAQSYINGISCGGAYTFTNNGGYIGLVGDAGGAAYTTWWDNLIVRKYSSVTPTYTTGSEKSGPFNAASVNLTGLSEGNYYWNVVCTDLAGNTNTSVTRFFTILSTSPVVKLITSNLTSTNTGNITLLYNLTGSGIISSKLILNGAVNKSNQSRLLQGLNNFTLTNLANGYYTWTVNATNAFGLNGTAVKRTFIVDKTPPTVSLNLPANNSQFSTSSINFNFTATDNIYSKLLCNLTVGSHVDLNFSVNSGVLTNRLETGLQNGFTQWFVQCMDGAGNVGYSQLRNINISAKPKVSLLTANNTYFNTSSPVLFYNATSTTGLATCSLYINGNLNQSKSNPPNGVNNFTLSGFSQGYYNWYVKCTDTASVSAQTSTRRFGVDLFPPSITLYRPTYGSALTTEDVNFTFKVSDSFDPTLYCNLSVNSVNLLSNFSASSGFNVTKTIHFSSGGDEYWYVTCWDWANNENTSSLGYFKLSFPPTVNLTSPANNKWLNSSNVLLSYNVSDVTNSLVNSTLYLNDIFNKINQTPLVNNAINNFTLTSLSDGHYNWSVKATNALGLSTKTNDSYFTIDTHPPTVNLYSPNGTSVLTWNNVTFNFSARDNLATSLNCNLTLDGFPQFENFPSQNGTYTIKYDAVHNGNHTWSVTCNDPAGNTFTTSTINFTVQGVPRITLNSPPNNNITKYSNINFYYTPDDVFGISQCSLYIDGVFNQSSSSILNNQQNSFSVSGIHQGFHNWTVNCTDPDGNSGKPAPFDFTVDQTSPIISLNYPPNNSGVYYGTGSVILNWTARDPYDPFITCNVYVDGAVKVSNMLVSSGIPATKPVSLSQGYHGWNATCTDQVGNSNSSATYHFNFTYPDFVINASSIKFNVTSPGEGDTVGINVTTYNRGGADIKSVVIKVYDGNPISGGTLIGTKSISISKFSSNVSFYKWVAQIGTSSIYAVADPSNAYTEWNESNNQWSKNITVGSWQYLYGFINPISNYSLSNNLDAKLISWPANLFSGGNIFITSSGASVSWPSLVAIGRTTSGAVASPNDFSDIDTLLNMTGFNDSVYNLYTNAGVPKNTTSFLIYNTSINNVPIIDSINNSNFTTGILWDSSDDISHDGQFDIADKEDLVFASKIHPHTKGTYGIYDYEVRVPAKLRDYKSISSSGDIYVELD